TFTGKILNFLAFNNGYHGLHHLRPRMHWSLLPEAHKRLVEPYLHPNLNRRSLLFYLFQSHIWPGKRVNYDGSKLLLEPRTKDEDWITELEVRRARSDFGIHTA